MARQPKPLLLQGVIPDKDAAIKFGGGMKDSATVQLDVYADKLDDYTRLLSLRGKRLNIVIAEAPEDGAT